jgi:mono/diheme cytochrome c family protein
MTFPRLPIFMAGLVLVTAPAAPATGQPPAEPSSVSAPGAAAGNVARGRYLVERLAMCVECHSGRDRASAIVPHERYMGGPLPFRPAEGWADRAPRIAGLPGYTDAQALGVLTRGAIGRYGAVLRPPMPRFRMTEADARDVIAFLRSAP